jgi:hypothetical protein
VAPLHIIKPHGYGKGHGRGSSCSFGWVMMSPTENVGESAAALARACVHPGAYWLALAWLSRLRGRIRQSALPRGALQSPRRPSDIISDQKSSDGSNTHRHRRSLFISRKGRRPCLRVGRCGAPMSIVYRCFTGIPAGAKSDEATHAMPLFSRSR